MFLIVLSWPLCAYAQLSGTSGRGGVIGSNSISSSSSSDGDNDDYFRGTSNAVVMIVAGVMCGLLLLFTVGVIFILTCCKNKTGPMLERARGSMMWASGSLFPTSTTDTRGGGSFLAPFRPARSRSSSNCGDKRYKISDVDCETANQLNGD